MPVEQRDTSRQFRTAGIALLMVGAGLAMVLVFVGNGGDGSTTNVRLGSDEFAVGPAADRSEAIAADGPILLSDVSGAGQDRPVIVSHAGADPTEGWSVFAARAPGAPRNCYLRWDPEIERLVSADTLDVDPATGRPLPVDPDAGQRCDKRTYPADGGALVHFGWNVTDDGILVLDLGREASGSTTTTEG